MYTQYVFFSNTCKAFSFLQWKCYVCAMPPSLTAPLTDQLIFIDKPSGFSTHSPDANKEGILELHSRLRDQKLFPVHRLDKETSGCLLAAADSQVAAEIFKFFELGKVKKRYLFLASQKVELSTAPVRTVDDGKESVTHICYLGSHGPYHLYEAFPQTGRTHQIRKHAQHLGCSILGDQKYGGAPFVRLALHAAELTIEGIGHWQSSPPPIFQEEYLQSSQFLSALTSIDERQRWIQTITHSNCWRLIHSPKLTMDLMDHVAVFHWYGEPQQLESLREFFSELASFSKAKYWWARSMLNRGDDPLTNALISSVEAPKHWQITENNLRFELRADQGLSFGLFLDQKANRQFVQQTAKDKTILNLFCYTAGFSVAATHGGARHVDSVDVSAAYGKWAARNFELNHLNEASHRFYTMDSREFVAWALKKQKQYDLIILDPPSFGRGPRGPFKLEKDLPSLLQETFRLLSSEGDLLLSVNYEKWDEDDLRRVVQKTLPKCYTREILPYPDFEKIGEPRAMKSLLISRGAK